jgi:molybdopterin-guanine dinucleotide biosynthesis protein A
MSPDTRNTAVFPRQQITAVILAGGLARRMGECDKGLMMLAGQPMIEFIIAALQPQVGAVLISANRNLEAYRAYGFPVVEDRPGGYSGPLAGMASGMRAATTPYLLTVPCDCPMLPETLTESLFLALREDRAEISTAHDGIRMQPVFALMRRDLLPSLLNYLGKGGRRVDAWYARHRLALADFSDRPAAFLNVNTPAERMALERRLRLRTGRPAS